MDDQPKTGLVITVLTAEHVSSETWHITPEIADALRAELGEPVVRQIVPIEVTDAVINDPRHVSI